ncbi:ROK family protein [Clostridium sp. MCC353]|uniref:ROK family protein n=1 Tax=Clostridium sp. MCC353 TaxID=2592646 RepID=UPI001C0172CE|nr:ROK family protein [Clostridium sp. MCC353]MBT9775348.1 ROK family protein [Clostridium sp. MCC353]
MANTQNKAALPKDLKRKNRKEILKVFQNSEKEDWSLAELSEKTGISRATVTKAVMSFVQKDILIYRGKGNSTEIGGKRPDVYAFNKENQFLAYMNIGIGWMSMAVLDLKLQELKSIQADISISSTLDEMIGVSRDCYRKLMEETGIPTEKVYGLCISTSGLINQETGSLQHILSYPNWGNEIPMRAIFEREYPGLVILLENVARAAGRAELYYNREFDDKKVFTLFTHRGISGCLIDQGKVQNSRNSLIGEIGHIIICPEDQDVCRCGSKGCFENMVSEERMVKRVHLYPERLENSILGSLEEIHIREILRAANQGDEYACGIVDEAAGYFAIALRNIILTVDPEIIVIQGRYSAGGEYFRRKIEEKLYNPAYFPNTSDWSILYDEKNIWKLAEIGLSAAMAEELFQDFFLDM